jgi:crotonobetainyl-CoA:carnitine CoA-transferase CaiB-like acyl-CoA transferase
VISQQMALEGIRVLDLTQALAGPYCAQLLGDLGADVVKIERPGEGDQARGWGPPFLGEVSTYFLGTNRNKRSVALDLQHPEAQAVLHGMVERADVFLHNLPRAASREKLGLDEPTLRALNPRLIYASITGFGLTGPYAERPGYDLIAQAMSGTMAMTGERGGEPTRFPTPIADITTGIYCAIGILTALYVRERTGVGQSIDTALLDSQLTWLAHIASNYLATGEPPERYGNLHPSIVPYQPFHASDKWIIVAVGTERLWKRMLEVVGLPELADDARFRTNADRLAHREALVPLLEARFCQQPAGYWLERLEAAQIPSGPIQSVPESLNDPQVQARGMVVELEHPILGVVRSLGTPIRLDGSPISYRRPAPLLGEHTVEVLAEFGFGPEAVTRLRAQGVIG